ncbi:MAG: CDC48 family AAA ATPase [Candidatus Hydrothermarchaeales archaeon]
MEVELKVAEALKNDVGRGVVRVDTKTRDMLKVTAGDFVEIMGKKSTGAIVWRSHEQDEGLGIVRMDGLLRQNAHISLGDKVKLKNIEAKEATTIVITPDRPIKFSPGFEDFVNRRLLGRAVSKGDKIVIVVLGTPLPFIIAQTSPPGILQVTSSTQIKVRDQPSEFEKGGIPDIRYEDIGGLVEEIQRVREIIELPMKHPELFDKLGIEPPKGVLLHGPPGTGKTLIAKAVANETNAFFSPLNGPEIMSKYYGESEENLRKIFQEAEENAPSIVFIDEIDAIAPKREEVTGEVERRVVAQLLSLMDGLKARGKLIVIGATNRPDALDPALRRPGRFDREIVIGVPDRNGRKEILQIHTRGMPLGREYLFSIGPEFKKDLETNNISDSLRKTFDDNEHSLSINAKISPLTTAEWEIKDGEKHYTIKVSGNRLNIHGGERVDLKELADVTHGFVGADLESLCKEAAMNALRDHLPEIDLESETIPTEVLDKLQVTKKNFNEALKSAEPSALREVFVEVPNVTWEDVGGLEEIKQDLIESVEWPIKYPEKFEKMGINPPKGILLFGPPGTGKTLLAKAVANESEANFISIKGPEVLSKWVGESEKAIREIFKKARQSAPTIVFFDEIDAIASMRRGGDAGSRVTETTVNQMLTEIDGLEDAAQGVIIIAATNRPDLLDPGFLRPGRFDKLLLVQVPDKDARLKILQIHTKNIPLGKDVDLEQLAEKTKDYTGADLEALCREAAMLVLRKSLRDKKEIKASRVMSKHFTKALDKIKPSVNEVMKKNYQDLLSKFESGETEKLRYMT